MSKMKDFEMWLEEKGHAIYDERDGELHFIDMDGNAIVDPVQNSELVARYRKDADWHGTSDLERN